MVWFLCRGSITQAVCFASEALIYWLHGRVAVYQGQAIRQAGFACEACLHSRGARKFAYPY